MNKKQINCHECGKLASSAIEMSQAIYNAEISGHFVKRVGNSYMTICKNCISIIIENYLKNKKLTQDFSDPLRWMEFKHKNGMISIFCPICDELQVATYYKYCPSCGVMLLEPMEEVEG